MTLSDALKKNKEKWQVLNPSLRKTLVIDSTGKLRIITDKFTAKVTSRDLPPKFDIGQLTVTTDGHLRVGTIDINLDSITPVADLRTTVTDFNITTPDLSLISNVSTSVISHESEMQNQVDALNREVERLRQAVARFEAIAGQRREE